MNLFSLNQLSRAEASLGHTDSTEWPRVRMADVCEINPRRPSNIERADDEPTSFIPMSSIDDRAGALRCVSERPFREVRSGYTYCENNDVLFAKITPCMQNGKQAICEGLRHGFGFASTEFHVIRCGPTISPRWVHYFVHRPEVLKPAVFAFTGSAGQQRLPVTFLEDLELPLPPPDDQKRIADRLTEQMAIVERARSAAVERLEAAEAMRDAIYREVFGSEAPFSASPIAPTKPTRENWRWHLLTDIARLATGHTPSRRCPEYWMGDIAWIQLPDIRALDGKRATDTSEHTNAQGLDNSAAVLLPEGTVCLSRTASVGFVTIMGRAMATSQDFVNWVCGPDLLPDFLMHLFLRCRREIRDLGSGATHHTIYFQTVEQFSVCVPSVEEQQRIVNQLNKQLSLATRVVSEAKAELAAIEAMPAAMLREVFGGD